MPHPLIDRYHNDLARALQHGKSTNEQNTYCPATPGRFADHKEKVIDLLRRVCTVSLRTVRVVKAMEQATR